MVQTLAILRRYGMHIRSSAGATALALFLTTVSAAGPPAKSRPATQDDLFGLTKVWTAPPRLTAEAWEKMQPKGGPQFGRPGLPGGKPPPGKPPAGGPKGPGAFGFEFPYVRGTVDF